MPSRVVQSFRVGTLFINLGHNGWAEKFYLKATDETGLQAAMDQIITWRRRLLPVEGVITYARVVIAEGQGLSFAAQRSEAWGTANSFAGGETGAPLESFTVNSVFDSLCFRVQAEEFRHASRFIGGIPDTIITQFALTGTNVPTDWNVSAIQPPIGVAPNFGRTPWYDVIKNYLLTLKQHTCLGISRAVPQGNAVVMERREHDITSFVFRGVRNKKRGRPIGLSAGRRRPA